MNGYTLAQPDQPKLGPNAYRAWRWRRKFRRLNHAYAATLGFFWRPCPLCGEWFGGHEASRTIFDDKMTCWKHGPKL